MTGMQFELANKTLWLSLLRLATLQRESVDRLALQEAVNAVAPQASAQEAIATITHHLQLKAARWFKVPDASRLPALIAMPDGHWGVLRAQNAVGQWVADWFDIESGQWQELAHDAYPEHHFVTLRLRQAYRASKSPVLRLTLDELLQHKALFAETVVGGVLLVFLGILISFYSMHVYDRVIPSAAMQTLYVLTLGVLLSIALEYYAKKVRSRLYEKLIDAVDQRLARTVYMRFLSIRLDQMPASVGTLAGQLRGYESVRSFLVGLSTYMAVDMPFALIFVLVIAAIAGPLALLPLLFFVVTFLMGLWHHGQLRQLADKSQAVANRKTGLLVETVEAAEIIKSGQGGWRMLGRWLASTDEARELDLDMRHINENNQHRAMALQQTSYVLMMAWGAWMASRGEITMGELIASSILSGRILGPVTQVGMHLTAWANVKAVLQGLDALWRLENDHHGSEQPVLLERIQGTWRTEDVRMVLQGKLAVELPNLRIVRGEKIGVLGAIGSGKTTFLRLLSGIYKPTQGRIWLDDVDLSHLAKPLLAKHMAYLPQDGRLLGGTLRENLLLGLEDPGDEVILGTAKKTGLYETVIAKHFKGLEQEIAEGGTGLSGGQRQMVNLTRAFLRQPNIWLLDEPTASLDRNVELQVIQALRQTLQATDTMVLVTHKPEMLQLVNRIIVMAGQQVVMDGPRDSVLAKLQAGVREQLAQRTSNPAYEQEVKA